MDDDAPCPVVDRAGESPSAAGRTHEEAAAGRGAGADDGTRAEERVDVDVGGVGVEIKLGAAEDLQRGLVHPGAVGRLPAAARPVVEAQLAGQDADEAVLRHPDRAAVGPIEIGDGGTGSRVARERAGAGVSDAGRMAEGGEGGGELERRAGGDIDGGGGGLGAREDQLARGDQGRRTIGVQVARQGGRPGAGLDQGADRTVTDDLLGDRVGGGQVEHERAALQADFRAGGAQRAGGPAGADAQGAGVHLRDAGIGVGAAQHLRARADLDEVLHHMTGAGVEVLDDARERAAAIGDADGGAGAEARIARVPGAGAQQGIDHDIRLDAAEGGARGDLQRGLVVRPGLVRVAAGGEITGRHLDQAARGQREGGRALRPAEGARAGLEQRAVAAEGEVESQVGGTRADVELEHAPRAGDAVGVEGDAGGARRDVPGTVGEEIEGQGAVVDRGAAAVKGRIRRVEQAERGRSGLDDVELGGARRACLVAHVAREGDVLRLRDRQRPVGEGIQVPMVLDVRAPIVGVAAQQDVADHLGGAHDVRLGPAGGAAVEHEVDVRAELVVRPELQEGVGAVDLRDDRDAARGRGVRVKRPSGGVGEAQAPRDQVRVAGVAAGAGERDQRGRAVRGAGVEGAELQAEGTAGLRDRAGDADVRVGAPHADPGVAGEHDLAVQLQGAVVVDTERAETVHAFVGGGGLQPALALQPDAAADRRRAREPELAALLHDDPGIVRADVGLGVDPETGLVHRDGGVA